MENTLQTKAYVVKESRVSNKTSIESLLNVFRIQRMTAHVNIQVVEGGISEVIVTEKRRVQENSLTMEPE